MKKNLHSDLSFSSSIAEVSYRAFSHNWKIIESKLSWDTGILPMVKTNGYGHDLQIISDFCDKHAAVGLGVANIFEAIELRTLGFPGRILNFGRLTKDALDAAFEFNIHIVVHSLDDIALLKKYKRPLNFHLEVDTGMNRLGICPQDVDHVLTLIASKPYHWEGIFTHFSESEIRDSAFTKSQLTIFDQTLAYIRQHYSQSLITHAENSGAIFNLQNHFDWVRPGIALYGYHPNDKEKNHQLVPLLEWKAPIMQIRKLKKGDFVSYNRKFRATKNMTVATLPVGYGDGFSRKYSGMSVGYQNKKCKVLGTVCMDLIVIDISLVKNPKINDMVCLMGQSSASVQDAWDLARIDHTIPYEVLTKISPRVIRTAVA